MNYKQWWRFCVGQASGIINSVVYIEFSWIEQWHRTGLSSSYLYITLIKTWAEVKTISTKATQSWSIVWTMTLPNVMRGKTNCCGHFIIYRFDERETRDLVNIMPYNLIRYVMGYLEPTLYSCSL